MENSEDEWNTKLDTAKEKNNKIHIRDAGIKSLKVKRNKRVENNYNKCKWINFGSNKDYYGYNFLNPIIWWMYLKKWDSEKIETKDISSKY